MHIINQNKMFSPRGGAGSPLSHQLSGSAFSSHTEANWFPEMKIFQFSAHFGCFNEVCPTSVVGSSHDPPPQQPPIQDRYKEELKQQVSLVELTTKS